MPNGGYAAFHGAGEVCWGDGYLSPALASALDKTSGYVAVWRSGWAPKSSIDIEFGPWAPISADDAIKHKLLARDRLRALLAGVLDLSEARQSARQDELSRAKAEQTRLRSAITRLLILVEEGTMPARDPAFAERMAENRSALAAVGSRIDALETQLLRR